jgi:hypothetical protein
MACVAAGGAALAATVGLCGLIASAGIRSHPMAAAHRPRLRWVTLLNLLQPLVRGWGRLRRLKTLAEVTPERQLHFWSGPCGRDLALPKTAALLQRAGCRIDPGDGWQPWDFRCQLGGWATARVTTAQQYDSVLRWRWEIGPTRRTGITLAAILGLAALAAREPWAFVPLVPLLGTLLHAVREQGALSKALPRCVAQAARSSGMIPMEHPDRPLAQALAPARGAQAQAAYD